MLAVKTINHQRHKTKKKYKLSAQQKTINRKLSLEVATNSESFAAVRRIGFESVKTI